MSHCSFHTCSNNQCASIAFSKVAVRCLCVVQSVSYVAQPTLRIVAPFSFKLLICCVQLVICISSFCPLSFELNIHFKSKLFLLLLRLLCGSVLLSARG